MREGRKKAEGRKAVRKQRKEKVKGTERRKKEGKKDLVRLSLQ
jgi:hypothetical protein